MSKKTKVRSHFWKEKKSNYKTGEWGGGTCEVLAMLKWGGTTSFGVFLRSSLEF